MSNISNRIQVMITESAGGSVLVPDAIRGVVGRVYDDEGQEIEYTHWQMVTEYASQIDSIQDNTILVEQGAETPLGTVPNTYVVATILIDRLQITGDAVQEAAVLDGLEGHIESLASAQGSNWKNRYFTTARKARLYLPIVQEEI